MDSQGKIEKTCFLCGKKSDYLPYSTYARIQHVWKEFHHHKECWDKLPKCVRFKLDSVVKMKQLRAKGLGYRKIAKEVGTSKSTVFRTLKIISELTSQKQC